ncbi:MAG: RHS repeat-associated core domain-containing protein [Oryzomonas sp.]|uniref:RHS repeat domain-containing protein n=1 Tax=Oryzomonas sp. TaxID=2855186 RepID=UPI00285106D6|nr:RHS repeat-associated core domain-containing protein [Oryzomonas sp.]MDR3580430.1 RHS repeat-associated core domain-containing protein [Oryzomonas sp.]
MKKIALLLLICTLSFASVALAAEQVYFYHTDPAGTPLAMSDSTGKVVWKADYKPFGEEQSVTASASNDRRFVGKEKDSETGFSYFGARYEDARIGRFIAPDPVHAVDANTSKTNEKMLLDPQRLNLYAYGVNNPYQFVDPDGRDVALMVDPKAAGGNGHASLFFQNSNGHWYVFNQGAAGNTSSGGNLGFLLGSDATAGVSIEPVQGPPVDSVLIKTNKLQDSKIANSALRSQMEHNYEGKEYNIYSNNCKDAVSDVINRSGAGIQIPNSQMTFKPNTWFIELKTLY